jgi:ubiquinone/menaquinone biosynthesis C-methylase UbiE
MVAPMDRRNYWNSVYPSYFIERTAEADAAGVSGAQASHVVSGDKVIAPRDAMWSMLQLLDPKPGLTWLEIGVGIGRSLPYFLGCEPARIVASDISAAMLDECKKRFADPRIEYLEAEAESLRLPDGTIDTAVCYGTFDATYQREALIEFARVLAPGGKILITGKNDDYLDDDEAALAAELGAERKGHPNYFTDTAKMLELAAALGLSLRASRHFVRRGDLGEQKYSDERPPQFYEYLYVFEKRGEPSPLPDGAISSAVSRTRSRTTP